MEAMERMTQLLLQVDEADEDALTWEWMDLEPVLSIADLLLLLKAADAGIAEAYEPLDGVLMHAHEKDPDYVPSILTAAWMDETNLQRLAQQARLRRLGLLAQVETEDGGWELALTPRGAHAVDWWLGCLADRGLKHDTLTAGAVRELRYPTAEAAQSSQPQPTSP